MKNYRIVLGIFFIHYMGWVEPMKKKVSIIIPAYNEEKRIGDTLQEYARYFKAQDDLDVDFLVVLNGCRDNTQGVVNNVCMVYPNIGSITTKEAGKGIAIREGFAHALRQENDLIGFVDADMATKPQYFHDLIKNIGSYDGIIASRYMQGASVYPARPWIKLWGRRLIFDNLVYVLFGMNFCDTQCGAKLFKRAPLLAIVGDMSVKQWAFDVELLYLCKKNRFSVKELPTVWYDQADSKLQVMSSGVRMLGSVIKLRMRHSALRSFIKESAL